MIIFKKIKWKNFLSTGNTFTEINLRESQTALIVGENGAGKSTLLDALSFVLYGKPFRNINKNQLINSINKKQAEVQIEFDIGSKQYSIKRGIKPNVFEIYCDDQLLDQHAEQKEYQEMLEKHILKLNHKSFNQIVILGSASFTPFMQLSAAHRREIIEDLLDIQIFSKMNVLLKDKVQANKSNLTDVEYKITLVNEKIAMHKQHLESLKQNNDELINQKRDKIKEYEAHNQAANETIDDLIQQVYAKNDSIKDKGKVQRLQGNAHSIRTEITNRKNRIETENLFFKEKDNCPTCKQNIEHQHKNSIVDKNTILLKELEGGIEKINVKIDALNLRLDEIDLIERQVENLEARISNIQSEMKIWNTFIKSLEKEITDLEQNNSFDEDNSSTLIDFNTELQQYGDLKSKLLNEKSLLEIASLLLKDSGIKTKIIKQYVPVMNKLINKYLSAMDFFVNFELNENFEEVIKSRFRDEFTYASFSEGEKMRIDLALLFTWRAIAKLRNSASTNLLIMDEVFDSSLDISGTEEFMKILGQLTKDNNTFIISHKGDQLADKFTNIIKFEKIKNFSRISR